MTNVTSILIEQPGSDVEVESTSDPGIPQDEETSFLA